MTTELAVQDQLAQLLTTCVQSPNTRRAYLQALEAYRTFARPQGITTIDRAALMAWRNHMTEAGLSAATVNMRLSGMKCLIRELEAGGAIDAVDAGQTLAVKGVAARGTRSGRWMNADQAVRFLNSPPVDSTIGVRDRALLAILVGVGLRREEAARLDMAQIETQDGCRIIKNLVGKGNRMRSLAIPELVDQRLQAWIDRAKISSGRVFRSVDQFGHIGTVLSPDGIRAIVEKRSAEVGMQIAAHDARRTFAALARDGGAPLEEIQRALGHASIETTTKYLDQIFLPSKAAGNYIGALKIA